MFDGALQGTLTKNGKNRWKYKKIADFIMISTNRTTIIPRGLYTKYQSYLTSGFRTKKIGPKMAKNTLKLQIGIFHYHFNKYE